MTDYKIPDYNITKLDLSNTKIDKLPDDIYKYTHMNTLSCNDNIIESLVVQKSS
jgi:Leucine-rich repeat (LRR) protein